VAAEYGLGVNLEPVSFARTRTLGEARQLIEEAEVDAGIVFDVLHYVRAGGGEAEIASLPPGLIRYVQINDGPRSLAPEAWQNEAMNERAYPGDGAFPLPELLRLLPKNVPWGVEAPHLADRRAGQTSVLQALAAKQTLSRVLERLQGRIETKCDPA
jgi:sugar phosphate isomerase/epimerase